VTPGCLEAQRHQNQNCCHHGHEVQTAPHCQADSSHGPDGGCGGESCYTLFMTWSQYTPILTLQGVRMMMFVGNPQYHSSTHIAQVNQQRRRHPASTNLNFDTKGRQPEVLQGASWMTEEEKSVCYPNSLPRPYRYISIKREVRTMQTLGNPPSIKNRDDTSEISLTGTVIPRILHISLTTPSTWKPSLPPSCQ
jgi:hypothetical protein